MQPCDVSIFKPLKAYWRKIINKYKQTSTNNITKATFAPLFKIAFDQLAPKVEIVKNGFRACGLYPFNPDAVDYSKCIATRRANVFGQSAEDHSSVTRAEFATTKKVIEYLIGPEETASFIKNKNELVRNENINTLFRVWKTCANCADDTLNGNGSNGQSMPAEPSAETGEKSAAARSDQQKANCSTGVQVGEQYENLRSFVVEQSVDSNNGLPVFQLIETNDENSNPSDDNYFNSLTEEESRLLRNLLQGMDKENNNIVMDLNIKDGTNANQAACGDAETDSPAQVVEGGINANQTARGDTETDSTAQVVKDEINANQAALDDAETDSPAHVLEESMIPLELAAPLPHSQNHLQSTSSTCTSTSPQSCGGGESGSSGLSSSNLSCSEKLKDVWKKNLTFPDFKKKESRRKPAPKLPYALTAKEWKEKDAREAAEKEEKEKKILEKRALREMRKAAAETIKKEKELAKVKKNQIKNEKQQLKEKKRGGRRKMERKSQKHNPVRLKSPGYEHVQLENK